MVAVFLERDYNLLTCRDTNLQYPVRSLTSQQRNYFIRNFGKCIPEHDGCDFRMHHVYNTK